MIGEFFKLQPQSRFCFFGGDEIGPHAQLSVSCEAEKIADENETKVLRFQFFDSLRIGNVRRYRRTKEHIAPDARVADQVAFLLAEMDRKSDAVGRDRGAGEPPGSYPA